MDLAARLLATLPVEKVKELVGGHQSRVFRVIGRNGLIAVAKVLDGSMVDRVELGTRLDLTEALADLDPRVCRPLQIDGQRVNELTSADGRRHYIVCYEFAIGTEPDPARTTDARLMGSALSELHGSMSQLPATLLPVVRPLRTLSVVGVPKLEAQQLLHGDFNASNLRQADGVVRIFDLDDCGYGPPSFDVANALYMVLFDSVTRGTAETYENFRPSFLAGYASASGPPLLEPSLDYLLDLRVRALGTWLDDLDTAPIGIRSATPAWRATLRSFVEAYRPVTY